MKAARIALILALLAATFPLAAATQTPEASTIEVDPPQLTLQVGETASLTATVRDTSGNAVDTTVVFISRARRSVGVNAAGRVEAYRPGNFVLIALVSQERGRRSTDARVRVEIPVTVPFPPVERVTFQDPPSRFYVEITSRLTVEVVDRSGAVRSNVAVEYSTSDPAIGTVNRFGDLTLREPGALDVTVKAGAASATLSITVEENPVSSLELQVSAEAARTGDVLRFTAVAKDARGLPVGGLPVQFAVYGETAPEIIAAGAAAHITSDGRFVAERSGRYTVAALSGKHSALRTVEIVPRGVRRELEVVGRGAVRDRRTSDLWIWEAADGRDYAITGTWRAEGHAYIWDVTDPSDLQIVREIQVDARTINDVKVSEDGAIAVIGREGASTRRNGIVILGVGNPREGVPVLAEFDDQLTGGVHNLFIAEDHVFALSAGRRYDIINIENPKSPYRVGRFELDTPAHGAHDVWVSEGIAFSSNWTDGVVAVDVGGGGHGGSPQQPVKLGSYTYPSGWSHAAFPYRSKSTGKFYVFAGDEWFPDGNYDRPRGTTPIRPAGWIHIVEWDDWENPREVARYQVPEAGSHNLWVEDDILYVGYYNGGLRVVDVSGELMGDLYKQGREIASFLPLDPQGYLANAPFVWGAQPYKGHIFFSDWHSGLWAVKLLPREEPAPIRGEPQ